MQKTDSRSNDDVDDFKVVVFFPRITVHMIPNWAWYANAEGEKNKNKN